MYITLFLLIHKLNISYLVDDLILYCYKIRVLIRIEIIVANDCTKSASKITKSIQTCEEYVVIEYRLCIIVIIHNKLVY